LNTTDKDNRVEARTYQIIGESLKERIRAGEFSVGGRLPPERELAESYNVGRTVIHDALVMLEVKGLVEIKQGSGVYVTRSVYESEAEQAITLRSDLPPATPLDLLYARQWLESNVAKLAASKATDADISEIANAYEMHKDAAYGEAKESMDFRFHLAIAKATHNPELVEIVRALWQRRDNNPLWKRLHDKIKDAHYRERWTQDHQKIVATLTRRDPDAAYVAMWSHVDHVISFITELQNETSS
jgi:DNA-binding FadR family transcriptional regulator